MVYLGYRCYSKSGKPLGWLYTYGSDKVTFTKNPVQFYWCKRWKTERGAQGKFDYYNSQWQSQSKGGYLQIEELPEIVESLPKSQDSQDETQEEVITERKATKDSNQPTWYFRPTAEMLEWLEEERYADETNAELLQRKLEKAKAIGEPRTLKERLMKPAQVDDLQRLRDLLQQQAQTMRKIHPNPDWKYGGFEELVLDCGKAMKAGPLPSNLKLGLPKSCYYNCQQLAFQHEELVYCEGYAIAPDLPFPVAHAWLLTKDNIVIDLTWKTSGTAYLGVPFSTDWLMSFLESRKQQGRTNNLSIFESNYLESFSLLKEGLPMESIT